MCVSFCFSGLTYREDGQTNDALNLFDPLLLLLLPWPAHEPAINCWIVVTHSSSFISSSSNFPQPLTPPPSNIPPLHGSVLCEGKNAGSTLRFACGQPGLRKGCPLCQGHGWTHCQFWLSKSSARLGGRLFLPAFSARLFNKIWAAIYPLGDLWQLAGSYPKIIMGIHIRTRESSALNHMSHRGNMKLSLV